MFLSCLNYYIHVRALFLYVGLLQWALGLSRTKGESPKDSYNAKPRENPGLVYMARAYMYIVNNGKGVILYGNEFIHHKGQNYTLKKVPNTRVATDLLHKLSHNYKMSYIAFLREVNLPHPPLKIQGQLEISVIFLYDEAKIIQNRPRTQIYLFVYQIRPFFYNWSQKWLHDPWLKTNEILLTFFAKYDHFSLIDNTITFN